MLIVQTIIADIIVDRITVRSVLYIMAPLFFIMLVSANHVQLFWHLFPVRFLKFQERIQRPSTIREISVFLTGHLQIGQQAWFRRISSCILQCWDLRGSNRQSRLQISIGCGIFCVSEIDHNGPELSSRVLALIGFSSMSRE